MIVQGAGRGNGITGAIGSVALNAATYKGDIIFNKVGAFHLMPSGLAYGRTTATSGPLEYNWLSGGDASQYEAYCQINSGTVKGATANAWLGLGVERLWYNSKKLSVATITVQIRSIATQQVLATAQIKLDNNL